MQPTKEHRETTIGGLAMASGVKVTTIRYYESIGRIEAPGRSGRAHCREPAYTTS